jgi:hypothetical protein
MGVIEMRMVFTAILAISAISGAPAQAETLKVNTFYPSDVPAMVEVRNIAIRSFDGPDGRALENAASAELARLSVDKEPYFTMVQTNRDTRIDAWLSGSADVRTVEKLVVETRKICIERDNAGKCIAKEKVPITCLRREINYVGKLTMIATGSGQELFSWRDPKSYGRNYCEREKVSYESERRMIAGYIQETADKLQKIAPRTVNENISIMENARKLPSDQAGRFKSAIRMTRNSPSAACEIWNELRLSNPAHLATLYNVALCLEQEEKYDESAAVYREAMLANEKRGMIADGIKRVDANRRALVEWENRKAIFPN